MLNNIYKVFKDSSLNKILKKNSEKMVVVLYNKNVDYTINVLKKLASKFSDVIFIYAKFEEPLVAIYYREQCFVPKHQPAVCRSGRSSAAFQAFCLVQSQSQSVFDPSGVGR